MYDQQTAVLSPPYPTVKVARDAPATSCGLVIEQKLKICLNVVKVLRVSYFAWPASQRLRILKVYHGGRGGSPSAVC